MIKWNLFLIKNYSPLKGWEIIDFNAEIFLVKGKIPRCEMQHLFIGDKWADI